jgi:hypothetical protein
VVDPDDVDNAALVVDREDDPVLAAAGLGEGERFVPAHGRVMKEWVAVEPASSENWLPLAREALAFVGAKR